jgi:hypothetical protein
MEETMQLVLNEDDLSRLKPSTRADLLATVFREPEKDIPKNTEDYDWENRVDLTPEQVAVFIEGCSPETVEGLRVIAEEGPDISAHLLEKAGIENWGHFQGRTTKRARTVTGNKQAYLLAWDDWQAEHNQEAGCGHYAVTRRTFDSLREYFDA